MRRASFIDIQTRDLADMRNGIRFVSYRNQVAGDDWPISGDEIAHLRAEQKEVAGHDCN